MEIKNNKKDKIETIKKVLLFLYKYYYIFLIIYIILSIISIYIALHCNNFFSLETVVAGFFPYIYIPFRYYLKDYCKMPTQMCFA